MRKTTNDELGRLSVEAFKEAPKNPIALIVDNVRSLHNVGSFFRSGDAFAVSEIWLCGITATPPNREIHKTALGAELSVEWHYAKETLEAVNTLREAGYHLIALEQAEGSVLLDRFEPEEGARYAIVVGNEVEGVAQSIVDCCDTVIEIPQQGTKHSLNVSVAAGIVLWQLTAHMRDRSL